MDELYYLDDCTTAFKKAASYYRRKKIMKIFKTIKKSFNKDSYKEHDVYVFNTSLLIASLILVCFSCILFFI